MITVQLTFIFFSLWLLLLQRNKSNFPFVFLLLYKSWRFSFVISSPISPPYLAFSPASAVHCVLLLLLLLLPAILPKFPLFFLCRNVASGVYCTVVHQADTNKNVGVKISSIHRPCCYFLFFFFNVSKDFASCLFMVFNK